jgi:hypothetical protein
MNSFYIWLQSIYEDKILSRIYVKYCSLDIKQQSINQKDRKIIQHFVFRIIWFPILLNFSIHNGGYSRNASCTLN